MPICTIARVCLYAQGLLMFGCGEFAHNMVCVHIWVQCRLINSLSIHL